MGISFTDKEFPNIRKNRVIRMLQQVYEKRGFFVLTFIVQFHLALDITKNENNFFRFCRIKKKIIFLQSRVEQIAYPGCLAAIGIPSQQLSQYSSRNSFLLFQLFGFIIIIFFSKRTLQSFLKIPKNDLFKVS